MKVAYLVLIAFVVACVSLLIADFLHTSDGRVSSNPALNGLRGAVQSLATGLVGVVSHYLGRRHEEEKLRCPKCEGTFPEDGAFLAHPCALQAPPTEVVT